MDIYKKITELKEKRIPFALVTVIDTSGSVPRSIGAKMLVEINGKIHGTIGGSAVEKLVIASAVDIIKEGYSKRVSHNLLDYEEKDTGMVCGGEMEFFIEPVLTEERVFIFGGGHIALALSKILPMLGYSFSVIDEREEFVSRERFPEAIELLSGDAGKIAADLDITVNDYVIIITHGHKDDYKVLRSVFKRPCRYLGMIGSISKRTTIYKKLVEKDKAGQKDLDRIHCPIGLEIDAETPEEIAISMLAEMIKIRHQKKE
ncbi:MAG: XdhC family protein [Calditrichaceae bacterium]|nr:XdhC family protein [Calditrichaceae bacterium]MBN2708495.1 XdhC family protein [Calditrichaceae bacterium]RQV91965.1 MAG: xanthine dehydrogenase [Calditrichota bacterium]